MEDQSDVTMGAGRGLPVEERRREINERWDTYVVGPPLES